MISIIITFFLITKCSWCLPLDQFYRFGPDTNDRKLQFFNSSDSVSVFLPELFQYDLNPREYFVIRPNGLITFTSASSTTTYATPQTIPIQGLDFIAPYWFDGSLIPNITCNETINFNTTSFANEADCNRNTTTVYYRRTNGHSYRIIQDIREGFNTEARFDLDNQYIVTWVINNPSLQPKDIIFQCILAYSSNASFVIFKYADDLSQLTDELNTVPIQAGVNSDSSRTSVNFVSIPNTSNIYNSSNVGIPGVWMFQVDGRPFTEPFPRFDVTLNTADELLVGQTVTLECKIGPAKTTDRTFNIRWTINGTEVRRVNNISGSLLSNYSDFYTIPMLMRGHTDSQYCCDVTVNFDSPVNVRAYFLLENVTEPAQLIISPTHSPLRVSVGDHLPIYCTAVSGFPLPEVQWFSEGIPVHPLRQPYQQIYLVPTDSAHTTTYTCVGAIYQNNYYRVLLSEIMVDVTVIVEDNSSGNISGAAAGRKYNMTLLSLVAAIAIVML